MKRFLYILVSSIAVLFIASFCTPYNSNKVNYEMIQGKWLLVEADHAKEEFDTVYIDFNKEQIMLLFEENKCTQITPYLNDTLTFKFLINDYKLGIYKDSSLINTFGIVALTNDSLILFNNVTLRKYKKIGQ